VLNHMWIYVGVCGLGSVVVHNEPTNGSARMQWFKWFAWFSVAARKAYAIHIHLGHEITRSGSKRFVCFMTTFLVHGSSPLVWRF
jgi:hypothetical protein